jgi:hypothetical protein
MELLAAQPTVPCDLKILAARLPKPTQHRRSSRAFAPGLLAIVSVLSALPNPIPESVNRPEQWICWQKPRDISLTLPKVTRGDYDPSDDYIGHRSI